MNHEHKFNKYVLVDMSVPIESRPDIYTFKTYRMKYEQYVLEVLKNEERTATLRRMKFIDKQARVWYVEYECECGEKGYEIPAGG